MRRGSAQGKGVLSLDIVRSSARATPRCNQNGVLLLLHVSSFLVPTHNASVLTFLRWVGERFRVTKSLDILLPRDRELVQWSEDGIAISLQLLGADLAGEGRAVQLSVDRGALDFEIKELAGRIALPPGPHSIRAELLGVTGCEECVSEVRLSCLHCNWPLFHG